jgi:hypothetical protein
MYMKNYTVTKKELLAIVFACQKWIHYVYGMRVEIFTDHASLTFLQTQPKLSQRLARWLEVLADVDFVIKYKNGKENRMADILSR